jgi:hypothetical protein
LFFLLFLFFFIFFIIIGFFFFWQVRKDEASLCQVGVFKLISDLLGTGEPQLQGLRRLAQIRCVSS